jgi:hypothetical protein
MQAQQVAEHRHSACCCSLRSEWKERARSVVRKGASKLAGRVLLLMSEIRRYELAVQDACQAAPDVSEVWLRQDAGQMANQPSAAELPRLV